jgi:hypothetical protein
MSLCINTRFWGRGLDTKNLNQLKFSHYFVTFDLWTRLGSWGDSGKG